MKNIRKHTFETNSSSSHSVSFINKKPIYFNWELEEYNGKNLVYKDNELFYINGLKNRHVFSSGERFSFFVGLIGLALVYDFDYDDVFGTIHENDITKTQVFDLPCFNWISKVLGDLFGVNVVWKGTCDDFPYIDYPLFDETRSKLFGDLFSALGYDKNIDIVDFLTNNETRFVEIFSKYMTKKNFVIVDNYEEW